MSTSNQPAHLAEHLSTLAERFRWNAKNAFQPDSPLYANLADRAADDREVLELASVIPSGQPEIVLLLGAVHYLLLGGNRHELADYYPSIGGTLPPEKSYPAFHDFCVANASALIPLLQSRKLQTNEVRRCALLLPAFQLIGERCAHRPLNLVEVGPSAGLNLLWDRYSYTYGDDAQVGNAGSSVRISSSVRGGLRPPVHLDIPNVASRVGIDLVPANVTDDDQMRWQRALIWPDQPDRAQLFQEAVKLARNNPPRLIAGDALQTLPSVLESLSADATPAVFHSFTLNQFPPDARKALHNLLIEHSIKQTLYRVSIEWYSGDEFPALRLFNYLDGQSHEEHLANCHHHGQWIEWLMASNES